MRKRSTLKTMNGGAFVELQKLYDETHGDKPFNQNSKKTIDNSIEMLDKLMQALGGDIKPNVKSVPAGDSDSNSVGMQPSDEAINNTRHWIEMSDPNSGDVYYYNTVSGMSTWEKPSEGQDV